MQKRIKGGRVPSLTTSSDEEEEADMDVVNSSPIKNPLNSMGSFDVGPPLSPMSEEEEEEEVTTTTPAPEPVVEQPPPPAPEEPPSKPVDSGGGRKRKDSEADSVRTSSSKGNNGEGPGIFCST